jgi:glycosyltransferase involved in cell wall biosynthesis
MDVIISSFGILGSATGAGNIAFELSRHFQGRSALKRVLCLDYDERRIGELCDFAVKVVPKRSAQDISWRLLNKVERDVLGTRHYGRILGEMAFDRASVRCLTGADILHAIRPVVPHTIEAARRLGMVTTARAATCHARFNKEIMDQEREKYGLPCIDTYCDEARVGRMEEVYEHLDWIITWCDFVAQTYVEYGVPRAKIRVLPVPSGFPSPVDVTKRASHGRLQVLYVAHTNLLKGLHYLLGAWENYGLHKIGHLTVCGIIDRNTHRIIERQGWRLHDVDFVGAVRAHPYYEQADVVVVPSLSEGFGYVAAEAMAYSIPVIVTEHCGNKNVVEEYETGFVVPVCSEEAIAQAIVKLGESRELGQYYGRNGREIAARFTWGDYSHRLFEEFEEILRHASTCRQAGLP